MSDDRSQVEESARSQTRDAGMTLPELMIAFTIMGLIIAVISSALIVTMRQQSATEGRLTVAGSEQALTLWLPGDLASAGAVSVEPGWSPCAYREVDGEWEATGELCPDLGLQRGSNALMLGWSSSYLAEDGVTTITSYTNVSYYVYKDPSNDSFVLARIECTSNGGAWSCEYRILSSDLEGPPTGTWEPGVTKPTWVMEVSQPLAAGATSEDDLATNATKNARRVIVTINGGGTFSGAGGGRNRISITAGGTTRESIPGSSMVGAPSFVEARSLCGGPIVLVIDESNSIGNTNGTTVKNAVKDFVNALRGTPVRLQVVGFHTVSHTLGTTGWRKTGADGGWGYNMADEGDVTALLSAVDSLRFDWGGYPTPDSSIHSNRPGGTNWEDALYRTLLTSEGLTAEPIPGKVVFFTDGVPTFDRLEYYTGAAPTDERDPAWPESTGSSYSQVGFNRANDIASQFRGPVDIIGVGIGGIASGTEQWISSPATGYRTVYYRAYRQYQHTQTTTVYEKASGLSSDLDFERYSSGRWSSGWSDTSPSDYFQNNSSSHTSQDRGSDNRRINNNNSWRRNVSWWEDPWESVSYSYVAANLNLQSTLGLSSSWYRIDSWSSDQGLAAFNAAPAAEKNAGLWRQRTVTTTTWVTKAQYEANNTTPDASDGWTALSAPEYVSTSSAVDWVEWPGSRDGINTNQFRTERVEGSPPYEGYLAASTTPVARTEILARLIGDPVWATKDLSGQYNNVEQATVYAEPNWSELPKALKAIALGDCGGTVTLQTKLDGSGAPAPDPFRYQVAQQFGADGNELQADKPVVFTNRQQITGNFDLSITSGLYRDVVIIPENHSDLGSYQPAGWSCRAGAANKSFQLVDIPGAESSPWKGIKVRVAANEAVSCTQTVSR